MRGVINKVVAIGLIMAQMTIALPALEMCR
jgi:hypothetical protein